MAAGALVFAICFFLLVVLLFFASSKYRRSRQKTLAPQPPEGCKYLDQTAGKKTISLPSSDPVLAEAIITEGPPIAAQHSELPTASVNSEPDSESLGLGGAAISEQLAPSTEDMASVETIPAAEAVSMERFQSAQEVAGQWVAEELAEPKHPVGTSTGTRARTPQKRGGRPRGSAKPRDQRGETARTPKPEIVCWQEEGLWIPAVEVSEEVLNKPDLEVLQNGVVLLREESKENCWRLEQISGEVVVRWREGQSVQETRVTLGHEGYLLFKLSGREQQGRRVQAVSSGSYLVMVPEPWERDQTLSGPPPVTAEPVLLSGYRAHFFDLERGDGRKIGFQTPEGRKVVTEPKRQRFELVGNRLSDASEKIGPLFGGKLPQIRLLENPGWQEVGTIVIGEEGKGGGKWRKAFSPAPERIEQELPPELLARKGGWYFVRFYDTNDELIDSLDFRFLCSLKEIRIPLLSPLPSEKGHVTVCVEFFHEPDCIVQPKDGSSNLQMERQDAKTTVTIPSDPTYDETRWLVGPERGPHVEVTILVERLWWGLGEEHNAPSEWKDHPLPLSREDFAATSKKALWVRLPRRRWVDKVLVGFERSKSRPYGVKVTEKTIAVPLREFGDCPELSAEHTQDCALKLWIERDGRALEGVVAVIPASKAASEAGPRVSPPTAQWVGMGRSKSAEAKAVLQLGGGNIRVHSRPLNEYFQAAPSKAKRFLRRLLELKQVSETLSRLDVQIMVTGSSPRTMRQAKAVAHALARALMRYDPKLKPWLKQAGFGGIRVKSGGLQ